jgi:hypothetical protein
MAIPYTRIIRQVIIRANVIPDATDNVALETAYAGAVADMFNENDANLSPTALKDTILASEKKIVELIANDKNGLYRVAFMQQSNNIASGGTAFNQSVSGIEFIGIVDGIYDSLDGRPLTEKSLEEVQRRNRLTSSFKMPAYHYAKVGEIIYHTRPNVIQRACAWNYAAQEFSYRNNLNSPMPQALESMWVADVMCNLPQETWNLASVVPIYKTIYEECKMNLHRTSPQMPSLPDNTAGAEPIKN